MRRRLRQGDRGSRALAWLPFFMGLSLLACQTTGGMTYFVAVGGADSNSGQTADVPFRDVAGPPLDVAEPGDEIHVLPGDYLQDAATTRDGEVDAPIVVRGLSDHTGRRAVLRGAGGSHIFDIRHSHIWLEGLSINGLIGEAKSADGYRSKLVYVSGRPEVDGGLTDVRLKSLELRNAGTECVRFKFDVSDSVIEKSLLENCGVWDFRLGRGQKNGEAIYIGTAPEQLPETYPHDRDPSARNWIHSNWIRSNGAECVDIKEGSSQNRIENNECLGQQDPDSGGISVRGPRNLIHKNRVHDNVGAGIRVGGDEPEDAIGNDVIGNLVYSNGVAAFKIMTLPQGEALRQSRLESADDRSRSEYVGSGSARRMLGPVLERSTGNASR